MNFLVTIAFKDVLSYPVRSIVALIHAASSAMIKRLEGLHSRRCTQRQKRK